MLDQIQTCKTCEPKKQFIEQGSYTFNLMKLCTRELKKAGFEDRAKKLEREVLTSRSIGKALSIMFKYLDIH
jgi:hypothetical protein